MLFNRSIHISPWQRKKKIGRSIGQRFRKKMRKADKKVSQFSGILRVVVRNFDNSLPTLKESKPIAPERWIFAPMVSPYIIPSVLNFHGKSCFGITPHILMAL